MLASVYDASLYQRFTCSFRYDIHKRFQLRLSMVPLHVATLLWGNPVKIKCGQNPGIVPNIRILAFRVGILTRVNKSFQTSEY